MKRCPQCNRVEADNMLAFCRVDGTSLINDSASVEADAGTVRFTSAPVSGEVATSVLPNAPTAPEINRSTGPTTVPPQQHVPGTTRELGKSNRRKVVLVALIITIVAVIVVAGYYSFQKSNRAIESIAVLPFENRSGNPDTDYLSDGLADSLIYRLSQLPNLKVSPTSSVMRYKGKETDVAQLAKELDVDAVMSGRLVQRGDELSISVQLIDSRTNKLIWAEQYDRKMADLLATQREIATTITQKLQLKLAGAETKGITKKYTDSNEAYQLYLKGRFHFGKRTKDDVLKSIQYFQQAINIDPTFALAYARIAEAYNQMPNYPYLSPGEAFPKAKAAGQRALEIDPTLSEAHAALGNTLTSYDWNWTDAERSFKRALELDPNSASAHYRYATEYLIAVGRHDEAIAEVRRALEIEPLDLNMQANLARVYLWGKHPDMALEQAKKAHDLEPNFVIGRLVLGLVYNGNAMYEDAIRLSETSLLTNPESQHMLLIGGYAYAKTGRRQDAEEVVRKFREIEKSQYVMHGFLAAILGAMGDKDQAFVELDKAVEQRDSWVKWIKSDPLFDPLRDDPRFKVVLERMSLSSKE
jgi:TolB-like protein/Tfp pilus assembly protein PilF